jgi:hypothetical protein
MKKILFLLLVLIGCAKTETTQPKTTKMAFTPIITLTQTGSTNQLLLTDITGLGSIINPNGWNYSSNPNLTDVVSIAINGTERPTPSNSAPIVIPSYTLMPTSLYPLPYLLNQQFIVTPADLGFTNPTFSDGLYQLNYVITTVTAQFGFHLSSGTFAVGDVLLDVTQGNIPIGTITSVTQALGSGTINVTSTYGNVVAVNDQFTNGSVTANVFPIGGIHYTTNTYTATPACFNTMLADCCIGNGLRKYCNCNCPENVALNNAWMKLLAAKEMSQCFQYNSALDTLYDVELFCNSSGCGCGQNLTNWNNQV